MSSCRCVCGLGEKERDLQYIIDNNKNKWCVANDGMQTCLGARVHHTTAEWHGLHGYSGGSVAHDMCIHARALARVLVWNRRYDLCWHGLRCGSSSRRPGLGRPDQGRKQPPTPTTRGFGPPCRGPKGRGSRHLDPAKRPRSAFFFEGLRWP